MPPAHRTQPAEVAGLSDISQIAVGGNHVLALIALQAGLGVLLWRQSRSARGLGVNGGFLHLLAACACDYNGRKDWEERPYASPARLRTALAAARGVDAGAVAKAAGDRSRIPEAIHPARVVAVRAALREE